MFTQLMPLCFAEHNLENEIVVQVEIKASDCSEWPIYQESSPKTQGAFTEHGNVPSRVRTVTGANNNTVSHSGRGFHSTLLL